MKHSKHVISVIIIILALLPAKAHAFFFSSAGQNDTRTRSEIKYAVTPDGWKLALEHVPPRGYTTSSYPVILCHGLGYNGDFWMLSQEVNLAQHLSDSGYDVWILSLRGAGKSTKWMYKVAEMGLEAPGIVKGIDSEDYAGLAIQGLGMLMKLSQAKLENASANPKYINWTFDDYVKYDVPTAIEYVKKATGSPQVFWVGHSMGGNVLLAHLSVNQRNDIRGVVTVGSQLTMANGHVVSQYINTLQWLRLTELAGGVDADKAKQTAKEQARALLFYQRNMEGDIISRLETGGTDTPSVGVLGQYLELVGSGQMKTSNNRHNYAQSAKNITVPLLLCAGSEDSFVNPADLAFLRDNVGSEDCQAILLGPSAGMNPYGHNDSLISRGAAVQVYPLISKWLDAHAPGAPQVSSARPVPQTPGLIQNSVSTVAAASAPQTVPVARRVLIKGSGSSASPAQNSPDSVPVAKRVTPAGGTGLAAASQVSASDEDEIKPRKALPAE